MFKPPFAEDTYVNADALEYLIDVKICVKVEGTPVAKHIQIPVSMPPIRIPSIFLLSKPEHLTFSGDMGDWLFVMVEAGSSLQRLNDVATLLNKIADTLHAVGSLLSFASVFIDALNLAATAVNTIPKVFFHVGRYVEDMDDAAGVDIDDEARSCLLIGLASNTLTGQPTTVTLYSDTGFEDDHKVFLVTELVSGSVIGVNKQGSFSGIMFDNNGSHSIDQAVESFRFGGP